MGQKSAKEEASLKHAMMSQATQVIMVAEMSARVTLGVEVIVAEPERAPAAANG